jgi:hypothetical protein
MHTLVLETHSPFKLDWQSQIQTPDRKLILYQNSSPTEGSVVMDK